MSAQAFVENLYPFIVDVAYLPPGRWNWFTLVLLPLLPWMSFARAFDELARKTTVFGTPFTWADVAAPGTAYPPGPFSRPNAP